MKTLIFSLLFAGALCAQTTTIVVCQMNDKMSGPALDLNGASLCFKIPGAVQDASAQFLATQTVTAINGKGDTVLVPQYNSFWDYLVKIFNGLMLPLLDTYPPPSVMTAKAAADTAAKAVDTAKAAVLAGQ